MQMMAELMHISRSRTRGVQKGNLPWARWYHVRGAPREELLLLQSERSIDSSFTTTVSTEREVTQPNVERRRELGGGSHWALSPLQVFPPVTAVLLNLDCHIGLSRFAGKQTLLSPDLTATVISIVSLCGHNPIPHTSPCRLPIKRFRAAFPQVPPQL